MQSMTFKVPQMDCAAEEQLVRMALADFEEVQRLDFDLQDRTVVITHAGDSASIEQAMQKLQLGASLTNQETVEGPGISEVDDERQRRLLFMVLVINFGLFVLELATGLIAQSMGLVADSLDMLADAIVYGLSLYAVGRLASRKKQIASLSGYFQLFLAVFGLLEVLRRLLGADDEPSFALMIVISLIALAGNAASLVILRGTQNQGMHMKASWIFTTNDVLVNIGVIVAGGLVYITSSRIPDLVVGAVVFCLVASGAFRILRLSR